MTGTGGLRIGVLGPLQGTRDGVAITMPRGRAGVLLAALAMSPGHRVGGGRLAELIWDDDQPERARARLQTVVARLRSLLPGVVVTAGDGYLLDIDPSQVDLWLFRHLVHAAGQPPGPETLGLLDEAVGLWRGEPLAGLRSVALERDVVPGLTEEYLSVVQLRAGLGIAAGRQEQVITELRGLTRQYCLREPLWELLLRALARAGRPAEAVAEYHQAREVLAAELGVDPSPGLQGLYQQLLKADHHPAAERLSGLAAGPAAGPLSGESAGVLRRLPADTRVFAGRRAELAQLLELAEAADGAGAGGTVVISAIDGMAGIGKTALAVHAAHRLAGRFPGGQLFIDLHGYTQGYPPRTAGQALEVFLRTLGVPAPQIPGDTEERAALYRERLAGTHTLIVLDNAVDEAQVRPLIPGSPGCLVLVTSRRKLQALDDAHTLALDALPEPDAIALLCEAAGPGRVSADDPVAADIAGLCGRLPLAVRIAAALLCNRPAWSLHHLATRLRAGHTRLAALSGGDRDLAALFDLSSRNLDDDQLRLYRCLGLTPGPEADAYAAAALLDSDPVAAERLLQDLVDHNLLAEPVPGRYGMHDLIRAHARTLAARDPTGEPEAALGRLLGYYQHTARGADARIAYHAQPGYAGVAPSHAPALPDDGAARAWLRTERANLTACLQYAIDTGLDERTVALSAGLASLLRTDGPWPQATAAQAAAVAAAARLGDRPGQARALTSLGNLHRLTGNYPDAGRSLQAALELHQETGDKAGQAHTLTELAHMRYLTDGRPGMQASLRAALELYREVGDKAGQARALTMLAGAQVPGDAPGAKASLRAALQLYREIGDKAGQAHALNELTAVHTATGEYEEAIRNGESALVIARELGYRFRLASVLMELGMAQRLAGDYHSAARNQQAAHDAFRELGYRLGQAHALTELGEVRRLTGDHQGAARDLEESIGTYRDLDDRGNEAWALKYYAAVIADTGDLARAIALYLETLHLAREVHQPDDEAAALHGLGETHLRQGKPCDGTAYLRQALEIYQRLGMPAARQVTARLAQISAPD